MKRIGKLNAINEEFIRKVKPIMESWGLSRHPNPAAHFGKSEYGYHYDFADLSDINETKLAAFSIINPGAGLWIKGVCIKSGGGSYSDVPIIFDTMEDVFTLTRSWSIFRPLISARFEFYNKTNEANEDAATRLIASVLDNLHKLEDYLYG